MNSYLSIILRGIVRRCPKCGTGKIFSGYVKTRSDCPDCGESFAGIRTDDAAPWATILVVGHFAASFIAYTIHSEIPLLQLTLGILAIVLLGSAFVLPIMKGIFVNLNWRNDIRYSENH